MADLEIGILGFLALFVLLAIRMPVGTAMLVVGVAGIWVLHPRGDAAAVATLGGEIFSVSTIYSLTILPLFILMGNLAGVSAMSRDLYAAAHAWFGHLRGGLASSTMSWSNLIRRLIRGRGLGVQGVEAGDRRTSGR